MKVDLESVLALLHLARHGVLATHSLQAPGFPYATPIPYVLDESHRPVLCISGLAEHTKNLQADSRASFCVIAPDATDVQASARLTMVCEAEWLDPSDHMRARFLRYEPGAETHLQLDFIFVRLVPKRLRFIAGVGSMGWLEASEWDSMPTLPLEAEDDLLRSMTPQVGSGIRLLGIDRFGIDFEARSRRIRQRLPGAPVSPTALPDIIGRMATELA